MSKSSPSFGRLRGIIHHCVECASLSPRTDAIRTLIGEHAAWRLSRRPTRDGRYLDEWRCPSCWASYFRAQKSAQVWS